MTILLTGRDGQVGLELERILQGSIVATTLKELDFADADAIRRTVRAVRPSLIVNAAAYTAVDRAESEPELAMRINGAAPGVLAEEAKRLDALLVHYSTDYVYDGEKTTPYFEDDAPGPLGVYGRTKLEGDLRIRASGCRHLILRTAWVYGQGRNFVRAILARAREGKELRVVNDQFGAPTWAADLARVTRDMLEHEGTYHATAAGRTSWYEVAQEVLHLSRVDVKLTGISTGEYAAPAPRPRHSVLDNGKLRAAGVAPIGDWRERLALYLQSEAK